MHNFLCRLFFYVLILMFLNTAFGSWPDSPHVSFYLVRYLLPAASWVFLFETVYLIRSRTRAAKPQPIRTDSTPYHSDLGSLEAERAIRAWKDANAKLDGLRKD